MNPSPYRLSILAALAMLCLGAGRADLPAAGQSRTKVEGCLAKTDEARRSGTKHRKTGASVEIEKLATGLVVTHELPHPTCLQGTVKTIIGVGTVDITTTLSGPPGRGLCHSTLTTTMGLSPGTYRLRVMVAQHGRRRLIHKATVRVP